MCDKFRITVDAGKPITEIAETPEELEAKLRAIYEKYAMGEEEVPYLDLFVAYKGRDITNEDLVQNILAVIVEGAA